MRISRMERNVRVDEVGPSGLRNVMTNVRFSEQDARTGVPPLNVFFGRTAEMDAIRRRIDMVSRANVPVLIQGESGTGKELCARLIHGSSRTEGELVKVSCPAIPSGLIETELFGYEKGAFTGAQATRRGRLEQADGGTLFLDEVGSLDLGVQAKLLQVLQDGSFLRLGGHEQRRIQTRILAVANRDLQEQVAEGTFRLDLLYRINAVTLHMPPLRRRTEDIPEMVEYFTEVHSRTFETQPAALSRGVIRLMQRYDWPGNIRQLDNMIRSYVLMGSEDALISELSQEQGAPSNNTVAKLDLSEPISLKVVTKRATQDLERQIILKVLKAHNWNRQKTAKFLKISYRSLLYKLNEVGSTGAEELNRARTRQAVPTAGASTKLMGSGLVQ